MLVRVSPSARGLALVLPEMFLPDTTLLAISLAGPPGAAPIRLKHRYAELRGGRTLLLVASGAGFVEGEYELAVTPSDRADREPARIFLLHISHVVENH